MVPLPKYAFVTTTGTLRPEFHEVDRDPAGHEAWVILTVTLRGWVVTH